MRRCSSQVPRVTYGCSGIEVLPLEARHRRIDASSRRVDSVVLEVTDMSNTSNPNNMSRMSALAIIVDEGLEAHREAHTDEQGKWTDARAKWLYDLANEAWLEVLKASSKRGTSRRID